MQTWDLVNNEPVDIELVMIKTLDEMEKEIQKKKWLSDHGPSGDELNIIKKYKKQIAILKELCIQRNINPNILDSV